DDAELLDALERRATEMGVPVETAAADVRELALGRRFGLILAPMQLIHLLGGVPGRARAWSALTSHLAPSGLIAVAMLHEPLPPSGRAEPIPDVREVDGWVHSSLPLDVRVEEDSIELDRLRQVVSPEGRLSEDLDTTRLDRISIEMLRLEVAAAGLEVTSTEPIPATAEHVASLLVLIEAADA
ncbi:MAG: hypothetical protein H0V25_05400, partial [Solirubrobacterales bacterium]|nr:hypothetical protein [Solirubrobacterales bacterium]